MRLRGVAAAVGVLPVCAAGLLLLGCGGTEPEAPAIDVWADGQARAVLTGGVAENRPGPLRVRFAGTPSLAKDLAPRGAAPSLILLAATFAPVWDENDGVSDTRFLATDTLVLAAHGSRAPVSLEDLGRRARVAVVSDQSTLGEATDDALAALGEKLPTRNVVVRDGAAALEALRSGRADAAFVFRSELRRRRPPAVEEIDLPENAVGTMYVHSGVVNRGANRKGAQRLQQWLAGEDGAAALRRAGFKPLPRGARKPDECKAGTPECPLEDSR